MQATPLADLELAITAVGTAYELRMRLTRSGDSADIWRGPFPVIMNQQVLLEYSDSRAVYGLALRDMLFSAKAATEFTAMRAVAVGNGEHIRIRLLLPSNLQALRWETLLDPESGRSLALDDKLLLSRYLSADDYEPLPLRPKGQLRALVAVAAPANAENYGLTPIDTVGEVARVTAAMGGMTPTVISATWAQLRDTLHESYDILYLVAHGMLKDGQPWLYLVNDQGNADMRRGGALSDLLRSLDQRRPRLVVLASCEGAGNGYIDTLAALGPQLARAGVPAVLAMQGKLSMITNERLIPVLFRELLLDGTIDRAVNRARFAVEDRPDWWMPVLYTRLRNGVIWQKDPLPAEVLTLCSQLDYLDPSGHEALALALGEAWEWKQSKVGLRFLLMALSRQDLAILPAFLRAVDQKGSHLFRGRLRGLLSLNPTDRRRGNHSALGQQWIDSWRAGELPPNAHPLPTPDLSEIFARAVALADGRKAGHPHLLQALLERSDDPRVKTTLLDFAIEYGWTSSQARDRLMARVCEATGGDNPPIFSSSIQPDGNISALAPNTDVFTERIIHLTNARAAPSEQPEPVSLRTQPAQASRSCEEHITIAIAECAAKGVTLTIDDVARSWLCDDSYMGERGVPSSVAVQTLLFKPIRAQLRDGSLRPGSYVRITVVDRRLASTTIASKPE